jgi:hypothetical protein
VQERANSAGESRLSLLGDLEILALIAAVPRQGRYGKAPRPTPLRRAEKG